MRKKSVFLSKVFAVALAASMAVAGPAASAATVSTTTTYETPQSVLTQSDGFWSKWSDFYRVSGDFDITIVLTNKSDGANLWDNYAVLFTNAVDGDNTSDLNNISGYKEYYISRADNYGWSVDNGNTNGNTTLEGNAVVYESDWPDEAALKSAMADAKVTLNITRTGDDFVMNTTIEGADSKTYKAKASFTTKADADMNIIITGEKADVSIVSVTYNEAKTDAPSTDEPAPGDTSDAPNDTVDTAPGDTNDTPAPEDTNDTPNDTVDVPTGDTEDIGGDDTEDEPEETEPTLNKKKANVKVGKTVKLKVKDAEGTVKWTSSNKKVAKVNKSGKVTGLKKGTATIKAKVDGVTLKCKVTVKK